MTNKVKPFFIRITDDMTPQMVQDAFDKCNNLGVRASNNDDVENLFDWSYFGVCARDGTYLSNSYRGYFDPQEITLDQLDEWLGLDAEQGWDGNGLPPIGIECEVMFTTDTTPRWYQCTINHSCQNVGVLDIEGEKCAFTMVPSNGHSVKFRKPETPEQKAERERIEAAYDLYCYAKRESVYSCVIVSFKEFIGDFPARERDEYLAIVDKTNYRKQ